MTKVTLILPIYNVEKYIKRCLDSIVNQTMAKEELEVILVDDGSPDDSGHICDEYSSEYNYFFTIHQKNAGVAAARNEGLKKAHGEYVAFIDPDDYLEYTYCEKAYNAAHAIDADVALFDSFKEFEDTKKRIELYHAAHSFQTSEKHDTVMMQCQILYPYMSGSAGDMSFNKDVPLAAPWDKIYRREFLISNNLEFPKELKVLDDMTFNFLVFGKAKKITYITECLYHYSVWQTSITNSYKADRVTQDKKVFEYIKREIDNTDSIDSEDKKRLIQAYYCRIIKSFAICCRLCFFNDKSPGSVTEKCGNVAKVMGEEPYFSAFRNVKLSMLEWKLIAVLAAGRFKNPRLLLLLHQLQNGGGVSK